MSFKYALSAYRMHIPGLVCCLGVMPVSGLFAEADYNDIETVEVVGQSVVKHGAETGTAVSLELKARTLTPPNTLPDVLIFIPSANIRTNSRGETLVSIRGSGERQFAVFFDGASVNVPWDNRIDLDLIPLAGVSRINVNTGPTAIEYGGGTAGGVAEILPAIEPQKTFNIEAGTGNIRRATGSIGFGGKKAKFLLAAGHAKRDGIVAEEGTRNQFTIGGSDLITNTDRAQTNFLTRVSYEDDSGNGIAASVLYNNADYSIAPEQGFNFNDSDARFWRFPESTYSLATINGRVNLGERAFADLSVWRQTFDQDIQSFTDITYSVLEGVQQDRNETFGARSIIAYETQKDRFSVNGSALWSEHRQTDKQPSLPPSQTELFTHQTVSLGVDYSRFISSSLFAAFGVGYEVFEPRQTAGRVNNGRFSGINAVAELKYTANDDWQLRASAGRRVRLPTMRELFGEAIGRFVLNPELGPEQTWQLEVEAQYQAGATNIGIVPFAAITKDTLDQRRVLINDTLVRQRFNLRGSQTYGVEIRGRAKIGNDLTIDGNATWNTFRVLRESVDNSSRRLYLSDRPNWLAHLNAAYQLGARTTLGIDVVHRGEARSQDGSGNFQRVDPATQVDIAFTYMLYGKSGENALSLYVRADNVTDVFVEPQLGLPGAGRTFRVGLQARL